MDLPLLSGSRRLDWEHLPAEVRQGLQARLGSPVVQAATQPGGFSPGLAARLRLADGRRVFVKAAGPDPNPHTPALHRAVFCTHGEVIGEVFDELQRAGIELSAPARWPKGSTWILELDGGHVWKGTYLEPLAVEPATQDPLPC
jgi:hypothetical protein